MELLEQTKDMMALSNYPKAMCIFILFVDHMDDNNKIYIPTEAICYVLKISRTAVWRNMKILVDMKLVSVSKSGNQNVYTVSNKTDWKYFYQHLRWKEQDMRVQKS